MTKRRILLAAVVVTVAIASVLAMPKPLLVSADSQNFQVKVVKSDFTGWADVEVAVRGEGELLLTSGTDANGDVFFNLPAGGWYEFRAGDASTIALVPTAFPTAALVGVVLMPSRQTQCQLTISVSPPDTGTTNPAVGSYWYDSGSSVSVSATATASGYVFDFWLLDGTNAGSSNPIMVTMAGPQSLEAHFIGPKTIKESVLQDLIPLRTTTTDKQDRNKLDQAIDHLSKSLEPDLWISETRLDPKHGEKVFNEEKDAVVKLVDLLKDKKSAFYHSATLQGIIDRLVSADKLLASAAIHDAVAAGGDAKKIAKANEELSKGDARALDGKFVDAIEHYRNAWKHAIEAMP